MIYSYSHSVYHLNSEHETESILSLFRLSALFNFLSIYVFGWNFVIYLSTLNILRIIFLINSGRAHKASNAEFSMFFFKGSRKQMKWSTVIFLGNRHLLNIISRFYWIRITVLKTERFMPPNLICTVQWTS